MSVWEGIGKEIMRLVDMGGKWEGNTDIFWHCKGKKYLYWGRNWEEKNCFVGVARKKEGKNVQNRIKTIQPTSQCAVLE